MKVSNFEHLARTPLPTFVFIIDFQGTDHPRTMYLCHFDQAHRVSQTLNKIRELEAAGETDLHKHSMTFAAQPSEAVNPRDFDMLSASIKRYTGVDLSKYMKAKDEWLTTVGYDRGRYKFSFSSRMTM